MHLNYDYRILQVILRIFDFTSFSVSFQIKGGGNWELYYEKTPVTPVLLKRSMPT